MNKTNCLTLYVGIVGLATLLLLNGCIGTAARAIVTDNKSYEALSATAGHIAPQDSRIWIYAVGDSWDSGLYVDAITFNKNAYNVLGDSFGYVDMPSGKYLVTTTNVKDKFFGKPKYLGEIQDNFQFEPGKEYFLRISIEKAILSKTNLPFNLVEKEQALSEIEKLKHDKERKKPIPLKVDLP